ncbi:hypothetical protein PPL_08170 [Heterostelium album PN500]|uniref:Uncharacterized protein n=1 Tax=Heterostelium pallidum (strain ATCC 26659 / Pp 5 / PN500) TaxID=670386 RepID=D3BIT5_HETP5|nr:hypothetical protein PPL_08170 [Heterostelium album PN500]EFA78709.1 hypothetical protein PPL_08170 [Heterostelium album PN500]|eukprot:XP_020430833.1 hypothetical protein PPL_08170 [Heterostelium album PN500]
MKLVLSLFIIVSILNGCLSTTIPSEPQRNITCEEQCPHETHTICVNLDHILRCFPQINPLVKVEKQIRSQWMVNLKESLSLYDFTVTNTHPMPLYFFGMRINICDSIEYDKNTVSWNFNLTRIYGECCLFPIGWSSGKVLLEPGQSYTFGFVVPTSLNIEYELNGIRFVYEKVDSTPSRFQGAKWIR